MFLHSCRLSKLSIQIVGCFVVLSNSLKLLESINLYIRRAIYDCARSLRRSLYDNQIESLANGTFAPLKNIQTL